MCFVSFFSCCDCKQVLPAHLVSTNRGSRLKVSRSQSRLDSCLRMSKSHPHEPHPASQL